MFQRIIRLPPTRSFFLFGARGTGKTTLLRKQFKRSDTLWIDLLSDSDETTFRSNPEELGAILNRRSYKNVVIDEIQKVPKLLDIVHQEIFKKRTRFVLTGSSARKLKRGRADLLAGRASTYHLYPLTHSELAKDFQLENAMTFGTLPELFEISDIDEKRDFLRSYVGTYLKEEILVEQLVRKVDPFKSFLPVAAQCNAEILNFRKIAFDLGVDSKTVEAYFQILEDTLIGFKLPAYHRSVRKQFRQAPKFYLFDPGVRRAMSNLLRIPLIPGTYEFGKAFEHWVIIESLRLNDYLKLDYRFSYLRTKDGAEIDLIMERPGEKDLLVEIKSAKHIRETQATSLRRLLVDWPVPAEARIWSLEKWEKKWGNVLVLPWELGLREAGLIR